MTYLKMLNKNMLIYLKHQNILINIKIYFQNHFKTKYFKMNNRYNNMYKIQKIYIKEMIKHIIFLINMNN